MGITTGDSMDYLLIYLAIALCIPVIASLKVGDTQTAGVFIVGAILALYGHFHIAPSIMEWSDRKTAERQTPEYMAKQQAFRVCKKSIMDTLENPYNFDHINLFNTRIVDKTGHDKYSVRITYDYINKNGIKVSMDTTCAIKGGVSEIVKDV